MCVTLAIMSCFTWCRICCSSQDFTAGLFLIPELDSALMPPHETWNNTPRLFTCLLSWSHISTYTPAWTHLVWTLLTSAEHALLGLLNPAWQRTCVLFRTHAITFFHSDAIHSGGISQECQRRLFFPFAPIFCDGKNYSPPWQITIKSIWKEQECWKRETSGGGGGGGGEGSRGWGGPAWRCLTI